MNKMKLKKMLAVLCAVGFGLMSFTSDIYAAEMGQYNAGTSFRGDCADEIPQTAEEQYQEMLNDPNVSDEECQEFWNKMFGTTSARSSITMKVLGVPYYHQETTFYCGPATAKQTITYLAGSAESQEEIWGQVKSQEVNATVGDYLKVYVNSKQSVNTYGLKRPDSVSEMSQDVFYDLNRGVPVILWIMVEEKGGNWLYTTDGHFLNASGINTGGTLIEVTDPNIGWVSGHNYISGKYWVTAQEAYDATMARDKGYYM